MNNSIPDDFRALKYIILNNVIIALLLREIDTILVK